MSEQGTLERCTPQLETALMGLDRDLVHFLKDECFIREDVHDAVLDPKSMLDEAEKAGQLVKWIKNRVKQDPQSYHTLVTRLKQGGKLYQPIITTLEEEHRRQKGVFHSSVATLYTLDSQVGGATNERNPHDQPVGGCPQASGSMQETPSIPHAGHQRSSGIGIASLSPITRDDLKQQLQLSLLDIARSFSLYSLCIMTCLEEKPVQVTNLCAYLLSLPAFTCKSSDKDLMLLTDKSEKLEKAKSIGDVFIVLNGECCSFLNFGILQDLVKGFKLNLDEENSNYPQRLLDYVKRHKIAEFVEVKPIQSELTDDTKELVLLLDIESTCRLSKLTDIRRAVSCIMGLKKSALFIHDISLCCVVVTFALPISVANFIFTLGTDFSQEQKKAFRKLSIQKMECNGIAFDFTLPCPDSRNLNDSPEIKSLDVTPASVSSTSGDATLLSIPFALTPTGHSQSNLSSLDLEPIIAQALPFQQPAYASTSGDKMLKEVIPSKDFFLKLKSGYEVREYQKELADPGIKGENYIIVAPTGSGMTLVAALVIRDHLQKNQHHRSCHVVFMVSTKPLAEQQKKQLGEFIPEARVEVYTGDKPGTVADSIKEGNHISVCTGGKLLNEVRKGHVKFDQLSLMFFDECHHAQKGHPYARLMEYYLEHQEKKPLDNLPQIIGITASPGAGENHDLDKQKMIDHLLTSAAIMNASSGFHTVTKNVPELQAAITCTRKILQPRDTKGDPFIDHITAEMVLLEQRVPKMKNCSQRWSQEYETRVQQVKQPLELVCDRNVRDDISTLNLLCCYSNALYVYMDLRQQDAIKEMEGYDGFPKDDKATVHEIDLKCRMKSLLEEVKRIPPRDNPLLKSMMETLRDTFKAESTTRAILFIRTKKSAYYVCDWVCEHHELRALIKPDVITGHTRLTGSGMTQVEQQEVMDRFRAGEINLLIATSVAEEGLDVPECNLVIRYQHVSSEIAQVHTEGRTRAEDSQKITILSSDSKKRFEEMKNRELNILVEEIFENKHFPARQHLKGELKKGQQDILSQQHMKAIMRAEQRQSHTIDTIRLFCKTCKKFVCSGGDIYVVGGEGFHHYVVPDPEFKKKITCLMHPNQRDLITNEVRRTSKIYCATCDRDWGVMCIWLTKGHTFPVIKCSAFVFQVGSITRPLKKWSDAPFEMKPLSDWLSKEGDDYSPIPSTSSLLPAQLRSEKSPPLYDLALKVPLKLPLQLSWRNGPDMPFAMGDYVQSVVVQGTVYVGGGHAGSESDDYYAVLKYDTTASESQKWDMLQYRACGFAMTVINNQLVLVGGREHGIRSKVLGVWNEKEWIYPYPEMPIARSGCSAVVYNEWLIVAGGWSDGGVALSSVAVLNTINKEWYIAPPTPTGWVEMKTAITGDTCYFMGKIGVSHTRKVYSVSLPALTSQLSSQDSSERSEIWKEISGLEITDATPLSISGSLLVVGGKGEDFNVTTAIHHYQPDTGKWVKVGDLPSARCRCTCVMIPGRKMLVAGGNISLMEKTCKIDIALINT